MEEKKKIALRMDDQVIFEARITRNEQEELIVHLKVHEKIEEVIRSANPERNLEPTVRHHGGADYYRNMPPGLDRILAAGREDLQSTYPNLSDLTCGFTQYGFDPRRLYVGENQLNFQIFRHVGISGEKGIEVRISGAITLDLCRAWLLVARSFVARTWQEYVFPVAMEATLTTREMVT